MDVLRQDLRYAVRTLLRRPGFALVAVLTLALGIGANTAIFSVVSAVLLRPLPWPHAERVMVIRQTRAGEPERGASYAEFMDWRGERTSFERMGVLRGQSVNLTGGDTPDRLIGSFVDAAALDILGATTAHGRLFTAAETEVATREPVAMVSDAAWRTRFGSRPDLVGGTLVLNGQPFTVVGILRPGFEAPFGTPDVWMPIGYYPNAGDLTTRGRTGVLAIGRLAAGATPERAQAELDVISRRLAQQYPETDGTLGADVEPLAAQVIGDSRTPLLVVLAAVLTVLLIACANLANLQLARAAARRRELSVRAALGAGRARLLRQMLTESLLLSLAGGAAGLLLAAWGVRGLAALVADTVPVYGAIGIDRPVLLFAIGATVLAGLLFGLAPAWLHSRAEVQATLTVRGDGGASARGGMRDVLVVAQLALCVVLLVSAGLLGRSLAALSRAEPGFDARRVLTLQFRLPAAKYDSEAKIAEMFARTIDEIRRVPGVERAALVRATPLNGNGETQPYLPSGQAETRDLPTLQLNLVSPGYFETMTIPRLAGRDFTDGDRAGAAPVAIVNARLARRAWPGESAIGKRVRVGDAESGTWATVVGVVGDTRQFSLGEDPLEQAYLPTMQRPLIFTEVVVRAASGDPTSLGDAVKRAIWRVDRDQPVWRVRALDRAIAESLGAPTVTMGLTSSFALLALLLAAVGVYGVTSYAVARRTHEVGIRMALGARGAQVLRMVVRQGMRSIVIALAIGLLAALGATRLLASQLYGVRATDPLTFVAVPLLLALVALAACWIPARRASRVDPMIALRME